MDKELIEKCRLTKAEANTVYQAYRKRHGLDKRTYVEHIDIADELDKALILKAVPIIAKQIKTKQ